LKKNIKIPKGSIVKHRFATLQIFDNKYSYPTGRGLVLEADGEYYFVIWENSKIEKVHVDYLLVE